MTETLPDPQAAAFEGIALCRSGDWRRGVDQLRRVAALAGQSQELPSQFYSYLGFGVARFERRYRDGITLCKHAVKREFYQPENYLNLARTYMLIHDRSAAFDAVARGLQVDSNHEGLQAVRQELGVRRPPVLPFLDRSNPVNRLLGQIRHALRPRPQVGEVTDEEVRSSLDRTIYM